jgi:hypothetical protein
MARSNDKGAHDRALGVLTRLQRTLVRRLREYVLENEEALRRAADGTEGYGFTLHQLDELFLSRLNLVERTIAELQKLPADGPVKYRVIGFPASRENVAEMIDAHLNEIAGSRVLGVTVSPVPAAGARPAGATARRAPASGDSSSPEDELLVTVLYYGSSPEPEEE